MKKKDKKTATPYDDVFRTLVTDCPKLLISLINELFNTSYSLEDAITICSNEFFITSADGKQKERITDSHLKIFSYLYHIECQTDFDVSISPRIFEYDSQIALSHSKMEDNVFKAKFPTTGILYLRRNKKASEKKTIKIDLPNGQSCEYTIFSINASNYTADEIFEKKLYFIIPFHIFAYENVLEECSRSEERLQELENHFKEVRKRLDKSYAQGLIYGYEHAALIALSKKVIENVAGKYENVSERISDIMGGAILDYESKHIFNEGIEHATIKFNKIIETKDAEIANKDAEIASQATEIASQATEIASQATEIARLKALLKNQNN